jgi:multicomponent K+:H+ antiporter subunit C
MTALIVMMALGSFLETGDDYIAMDDDAPKKLDLPRKPGGEA